MENTQKQANLFAWEITKKESHGATLHSNWYPSLVLTEII